MPKITAEPATTRGDARDAALTRILGGAAGGAVLVGAAVMLVTLVASPGSWLAGYVSETGTAGLRFAVAYRTGLILLAAGVALLGLALRPAPRPVAALLGVAAFLAAVSGVVPCTNQCPLPPFEPTTLSDVVHTAASIIGMVMLAGVMAMIGFSSLLRSPALTRALSFFAPAVVAFFRPASRRLSAVGATLMVPLGAALGLTMLFAGRGPVGAILERLALTVAVSWLIGMSLLTILRSSVKVESWSRSIPPHSKTGSRSSNDASPS
ncbi:hypothetical protein GCM10010435_11300 [Winogradskya consettensis]|uniref:DUF998 domain-containing protein n=1 Tax=Winogradskya consettensis TaxID=113560 RepID=A0A919SZN4_9ACTN|nr:DUF998 domain-containing protein [Actinoplanes consettensis]GIM80331.1 hypothetical protein Aco04nite_70160 [Actinoplanes consettensis]